MKKKWRDEQVIDLNVHLRLQNLHKGEKKKYLWPQHRQQFPTEQQNTVASKKQKNKKT